VDSVQLGVGAGDGVRTTYRPRLPSYSVAFQPDSPDASAAGLVAEPDVDPAAESLVQMQALRAYQANASVLRSSARMRDTLLSTLA
jgi:flagellar basal-body rod protein FlgC